MDLGSYTTSCLAFHAPGILAASVLVLLGFLLFHRSSRGLNRLPPGPPSWPVIGNLNRLGKFAHRNLAQMANEYGPIFYLRLGSMHAIVVSSPDLAKEVLNNYDKVFADHVSLEAAKRMLYPNTIFFLPYGPCWREIRKIWAVELLSARRLEETMSVRLEEINILLQGIEKQSRKGQEVINLSLLMSDAITNVMGRLLMSRRASEHSINQISLREIVRSIAVLFGTPVLGDFIPYVGWLDILTKRSMDRLHKDIDTFLEDVVNERQRNQPNNRAGEPRDFLDVLLSVYDNLEAGDVKNNVIKTILLDMITAGIDGLSNTLEWLIAELLRNPEVLQKLQNELDSLIMEDETKLINESQATNLPYFNAVIKETFRLHPSAPLLNPHMSNQRCELAGYVIPEKTRVFVNVWAIGRSHSTWESPEEFKPERFNGQDTDIKGRHFELIPFGAGRRICPGLPLSMSVVQLTAANLVRNFNFSLPSGQSPKDLDMTEEAGITVRKARPLLVVAKPRFNPLNRSAMSTCP